MAFFNRDSYRNRFVRASSPAQLYQLISERKAPDLQPLIEVLQAGGYFEMQHYYQAALNAYKWELVRVLTRYQNNSKVKQAVDDSEADTIEQFCQGYMHWAEEIADDFDTEIEVPHPDEEAAFAARVIKERLSRSDIDLHPEANDLREQVEENTEMLEQLITGSPFS